MLPGACSYTSNDQFLLYRVTLKHKPFNSKKETAYQIHLLTGTIFLLPSLKPLVSWITSTDTGNNMNKRAGSPPRSGGANRTTGCCDENTRL